MTESSENKGYTAADIARYHAGQMTAAEMHALEKAAMEDPFLADALEGYTFTSTPAEDLQKIRARLAEKQPERKVVPFIFRNYNWLRVAAVILLVAGGGWFAMRMMETDKNNIAQKRETLQQSVAQDTFRSARNKDVVINDTNTATVSTETQAAGSTKAFSVNGTNDPPLAVHVEPHPSSTEVKPTHLTRSTSAADSNRPDLNPYTVYGNQAGRIDTTDNFATGKGFHINLDQETATVVDDSVTDLVVVMKPSREEVTEVVVNNADKATARPAAKKLPAPVVDTLEPTEGWARFNEYVTNNIQVPDELKNKQIVSGEVELAFDVNRKGEPVNITVTRSLCPKCDEEAIRLLKQGPKWKQSQNSKGRVTIKF